MGCYSFYIVFELCSLLKTLIETVRFDILIKQLSLYLLRIINNNFLIHKKVCQWLATGRWFSPGTPVSSTNKTDLHDITDIFLQVALNTIAHNPFEILIKELLLYLLWIINNNFLIQFLGELHLYQRWLLFQRPNSWISFFFLQILDYLWIIYNLKCLNCSDYFSHVYLKWSWSEFWKFFLNQTLFNRKFWFTHK